jgi:hypothetical protein
MTAELTSKVFGGRRASRGSSLSCAVRVLRATKALGGELPRVYLAGKIDKNDWRHPLVPGLRDARYAEGPIRCEGFIYMGPFFANCDHGCLHGPNTHGLRSIRGRCPAESGGEVELSEKEVVERSLEGVRSADFVFAYISSDDAYGTIFELAYAQLLGVPVIIAFAPGIAARGDNDFWFVTVGADRVWFNITETSLPSLFSTVIKLWGEAW